MLKCFRKGLPFCYCRYAMKTCGKLAMKSVLRLDNTFFIDIPKLRHRILMNKMLNKIGSVTCFVPLSGDCVK